MKKVLIIYGLLVAVILVFVVLRFRGIDLFPQFEGNNNNASVTINEQKFDVEIADEENERMQGLSDRENLPRENGMLFIFEEKQIQGFWMKNVNFPLDIIFISDNKIVDIAKNAEPKSEEDVNLIIYQPKEAVNFVLEVNGGLSDEYGFEIGDEVTFQGIN